MLVKLKEEHLMWVLSGTRFEDKTIDFYRNYYVERLGRKEALKIAEFTPQFAQKKIERFEKLFTEKCEKESIKVSTILHTGDLENAINALDSIIQRYNQSPNKKQE